MSGVVNSKQLLKLSNNFQLQHKRNYVSGVIQNVRTYFGFSARDSDESKTSTFHPVPYIKYPVVTNDQVTKMHTNDLFKFDYSYSSYAHHSEMPMIHSLSDLTDPTQLNSLLPKRRPIGSVADTLSIKAGDDAMLVSPTVLAVADGVSGWESKGENCSSGIWSRSMVETLSRLLTEYKISHLPHHLLKRDIDQILDDSFLHTSHLMDLQNMRGSSTLVLSMLSGNHLNMISIGDSKIYVIRDGELVDQNEEQMISDLCPQQIGTQTLARMPSEMAWVDSVEIKDGDIVVMCSDGISDNLYEWEILNTVKEYIGKKDGIKKAAKKLLSQAKEVAFDDYASTPYNDKLNNLHLNNRSAGGKLDDMTLVIAQIKLN